MSNETLELAWKRWERGQVAAERADFDAGWREALGSLPASGACDCLMCHAVAALRDKGQP